MLPTPVHNDDIGIDYHENTRIFYVTYKGELTPDKTVLAYRWFDQLVAEIGLLTVYGAVFDFRLVTRFHESNLAIVQRESRNINIRQDLSSLPVAMIVDTFFKEQMVRITMQINQTEHRTRIVHDEEGVLAFFKEYHANRSASDSELS